MCSRIFCLRFRRSSCSLRLFACTSTVVAVVSAAAAASVEMPSRARESHRERKKEREAAPCASLLFFPLLLLSFSLSLISLSLLLSCSSVARSYPPNDLLSLPLSCARAAATDRVIAILRLSSPDVRVPCLSVAGSRKQRDTERARK